MDIPKDKVSLIPHILNNEKVFDLAIGINNVGTYTESELRHIIQQMDNKI